MAMWTHVAGIIRLDCVPFAKPLSPYIGNTVRYDSALEDWKKCDVPCGSEGSVEIVVNRNPDENSVPAFTVSLWGDLRDFGSLKDIDSILDYLNRFTSKNNEKHLWIRQGMVQVIHDHENHGCVFQWNAGLEKWEKGIFIAEGSPE